MISIASSIIGTALLAALFFHRLQDVPFDHLRSAAITALAVMQCAVALPVFDLPALILATLTFTISASAIDFVRQRDARSLIVLGGSLAGIQVVSPLGGLIAAAAIPPLVCLRGRTGAPSQRAGLLALLLFAPASSAVLLALATRNFHMDAAVAWPGGAVSIRQSVLAIADVRLRSILTALAFAGIALPVWYGALHIQSRLLRMMGLVLSAIIATLFLAAFFGRSFAVAQFIPALASVSVICLSAWPADRSRDSTPIVLTAISTTLSWIAVVGLS